MAAENTNETPKIKDISSSTQKRLIKDITDIYRRNPLTDMGIYYRHDDEYILRGKAMIIGPEGTPYENGMYFFSFKFPEDYPTSPPKVKMCTQDGKTRFHPNLYRNGKVCLSILNTWHGDGWTSCQSISSVLLTLKSIMTEKALLNEPGIKESHRYVSLYDEVITYKNIETAVLGVIDKTAAPIKFIDLFQKQINEHFQKSHKKIEKSIDEILKKNKNKQKIAMTMYSMHNTVLNPEYLQDKFTTTLEEHQKTK